MFSFIIVQAVKEGRAKTATHVVFVVNEDIDDDLLVARQNLKVNSPQYSVNYNDVSN